MREIKAFVRTSRLDDVVEALQRAGAAGITVSRVHGVGYGYTPRVFKFDASPVRDAPQIAKVEVVCREADAPHLVKVLTAAAWTGLSGDGLVSVAPLERVVKVRTGEERSEALVKKGEEP